MENLSLAVINLRTNKEWHWHRVKCLLINPTIIENLQVLHKRCHQHKNA